MRRSFAVFAAAILIVVMCGAAWAANYSMNIDHNTVSFLTKDYKAQYGQQRHDVRLHKLPPYMGLRYQF